MTRQESIALLAWDAAVRSHRMHQSHLLDDERSQSYDMANVCGMVALKALYAIHPDMPGGQGFAMPLLVASGQ